METINWQDSYFTSKKMLPEVNDDLTTLWGRKIIQNLSNGYGLIGSLQLDKRALTFINLRLNKKYDFPPMIQILVKKASDTQYTTLRDGDVRAKQIIYGMNSSGIMFVNNGDWRNEVVDVVFRIHGV